MRLSAVGSLAVSRTTKPTTSGKKRCCYKPYPSHTTFNAIALYLLTMTALRFLSFLLMIAFSAAFAPRTAVPRTVAVSQLSPSSLAMSVGGAPKGLDEVDSTEASAAEPLASVTDEDTYDEDAPKAVYRNLARGGEMTEVPWIDPAMAANTKPWEMSWWAYIIFGLPVTLLLNDFLHFIPTEGPLSFLYKL